MKPGAILPHPVRRASANAAHSSNILNGPQQQVVRIFTPPVVVIDEFWLVFLRARIRIIFHATDGIWVGPLLRGPEEAAA